MQGGFPGHRTGSPGAQAAAEQSAHAGRRTRRTTGSPRRRRIVTQPDRDSARCTGAGSWSVAPAGRLSRPPAARLAERVPQVQREPVCPLNGAGHTGNRVAIFRSGRGGRADEDRYRRRVTRLRRVDQDAVGYVSDIIYVIRRCDRSGHGSGQRPGTHAGLWQALRSAPRTTSRALVLRRDRQASLPTGPWRWCQHRDRRAPE